MFMCLPIPRVSCMTHQGVQLDSLVGSCPVLILGGVPPNPEVDVVKQLLQTEKIQLCSILAHATTCE